MPSLPNVENDDYIKGVFSIEKTAKIGSGTTARRVKQQVYFFAQQVDDNLVYLQGLNHENVPFGRKTEITKDELLQDYLPEPSLYNEVMSKLREVQKALARGEKFRKRGETFTAEFEFNKALELDEQNVRANFGIGMCYMQRGEEDKAREVFDRIIKIDAAFEDEHKHLFNEYGITLRKKKMYQEAADYYQRAIELSADDENLYYNLARAEFENENYKSSLYAVLQCLTIAPEHPEGLKLKAYIEKKGLA
ncbi:tetratricopeptide repeat protein [Salidesulfovibrio brasiliensis]|uniref:tetratricopeptide repeat protein n=1 Tax=Salidesulfovibrio brasiliensis TaxID=221711 RepID=UPI0006D1BBC0|nr:tetratricopeptide repeat protein [Salidesulfovibrio brasiliensis]